jgi:hypothetical protein
MVRREGREGVVEMGVGDGAGDVEGCVEDGMGEDRIEW